MIQFYSPGFRRHPYLGPEEATHCIRVLRYRSGEVIYVTDGEGRRFECEILTGDTRHVELKILNEVEIKKGWDYTITLVVAPTKNADRMAWLVEKATEIGVDRIVFVKCSRSERKYVNIDRLRRNAVSAMNQSLKTYLPEISCFDSLNDALKLAGQKFFGYCDSISERKVFVKEITVGEDVTLLIGPEGDFSPQEVTTLQGGGYKAVTFGNERLRTETAALYGVTAIHILNDYQQK